MSEYKQDSKKLNIAAISSLLSIAGIFISVWLFFPSQYDFGEMSLILSLTPVMIFIVSLLIPLDFHIAHFCNAIYCLLSAIAIVQITIVVLNCRQMEDNSEIFLEMSLVFVALGILVAGISSIVQKVINKKIGQEESKAL
jgi:hypothetical protein